MSCGVGEVVVTPSRRGHGVGEPMVWDRIITKKQWEVKGDAHVCCACVIVL